MSWHAASFTLVVFKYYLIRVRDLFVGAAMKTAMGMSLPESFSAEVASSANAAKRLLDIVTDLLTPKGQQNTFRGRHPDRGNPVNRSGGRDRGKPVGRSYISSVRRLLNETAK